MTSPVISTSVKNGLTRDDFIMIAAVVFHDCNSAVAIRLALEEYDRYQRDLVCRCGARGFDKRPDYTCEACQ